jgi:hypothetical protein
MVQDSSPYPQKQLAVSTVADLHTAATTAARTIVNLKKLLYRSISNSSVNAGSLLRDAHGFGL